MSPVTIRLDAQFGTPYPRSAGFDTDNARADALSADGPKRLIYTWRYVDRVHASSQEEYLLAPDHHTGEIALTRRQAANQHLASCEAEEEALYRCAGKRPRTRALVVRRKRSCERRGFYYE